MKSDYYLNQLKTLIGGKITQTCTDASQEFFGIIIKKGRKEYTLWFLQDDEGNGPGSFDINE